MLQSVKLADSTFSWLFDPPFDNDLIVLIQFTSYFQMTIFLFYSFRKPLNSTSIQKNEIFDKCHFLFQFFISSNQHE